MIDEPKNSTGLTKRIVVGLDVQDGKVVKCVQFRNPSLIGDPADLGRLYEEQGADELVYLDIAASLEGRSKMLEWIERTAESVFIPFTVVGGVRNLDDFRDMLLAGADKVGLNTGAVANPDLLNQAADIFGSQCVVLTLDAKQSPNPSNGEFFWEVFTHSGTIGTGRDAMDWALEAQERGAGEIVYTCIDKDGTREGYDLVLTKQLAENLTIPVVASGGAGVIDHIREVFDGAGAEAALIASMVHYREFTINAIKAELQESGVRIRP